MTLEHTFQLAMQREHMLHVPQARLGVSLASMADELGRRIAVPSLPETPSSSDQHRICSGVPLRAFVRHAKGYADFIPFDRALQG